jgi:hypothetical protein
MLRKSLTDSFCKLHTQEPTSNMENPAAVNPTPQGIDVDDIEYTYNVEGIEK